MKQLENLKQNGSVSEYQAKFEQLARSILLYNPAYDDVFFVNCFLSGLKEDIRAPITLHRPKNLETAASLDLLQEAELDSAKAKNSQKSEFLRFSTRSTTQTDKGRPSFRQEESRKDKSSLESSWTTLKAQHKANGLCFFCCEKWTGRNHKCPTQVPLHIIQELLDVFQLSASEE